MDETHKLPPPVTVRDVAQILRRRALIALVTFVVVVAAAAFVTGRIKRVYEAHTRISIEGLSGSASTASLAEILAGGGGGGGGMEVAIEKMKSRSFLSEVITKGHLTETNPDDLRNRLEFTPNAGGQILDIGVRARSASEAQRTADTTARIFIVFTQQEFAKKADVSQGRLRKARDEAEQEKIKAESVLNAFTARLGNSDPTTLFQTQAQKTMSVKNALADTRRNLPVQQEQLASYKKQVATISPTVEVGFAQNKNVIIDSYNQEIVALETRRRDTLENFAPDSFEVQEIENQIKSRQKAVADAQTNLYSKGSVSFARNPDYSSAQTGVWNMEHSLRVTQKNIGEMAAQLGTLESEQKQLARLKSQYEGLRRARELANDAYEHSRASLLQIDQNKLLSPPLMQILDPAQLPGAPISPRPVLNGVMAVGLGLFLAIGMALLAEYMAGGFVEDTLSDLPQAGGVPLLGTVPVALAALPAPGETANPLMPVAHAASANTEDALREIGYTLAHRHGKEPVPVILLAGTRTDETTASVAAQLTALLVRDGLRVTLVDADRAHPRLNHIFGAPDAPGLADALAGRKSAKSILHVGADGSLRFLAAGSPDDLSPLSETKLRAVFKELADDRDTDLVIVSGPSVWGARVIAPLEKAASGMALIVPSDIAVGEAVVRARRFMTNGYKPRILGVIVGQNAALPLTAPVEGESL